ncbi:hypothetical protein SEA_LENNON_67 [Gordonia phage Lennon]|uniref:Uncharacterized protein n=6 Tax=Vividuovirus TaxID=2560251 RepID=A0A2U9PG44_9CAUD|nr:hypothetical protein FDI74_gp67 [Gordonia phage Lennon]YP_010099141.1 hypothetical protein KNU17_gp64 [Gordonia phage Ailee]YP_010099226.1 hypothetical protein KNU18_gp66 [Gordonia phage Bibwit]YP_010099562.1 hypothetical protein KNU22_gp63 [Gordonia phage Stultus]YP_010104562.1 hypothetical protein KNU77_gp66 [Gordonia phage Keitabear]AWT50565.1 hypothetical protein PBI_SITAR_67 [Gordonia phage Sitar]QUE25941.1 hypothetical protein SEA_SANJUJU_66 [Gordonia phage Sanjuju]QWT30196.1 hypoth
MRVPPVGGGGQGDDQSRAPQLLDIVADLTRVVSDLAESYARAVDDANQQRIRAEAAEANLDDMRRRHPL